MRRFGIRLRLRLLRPAPKTDSLQSVAAQHPPPPGVCNDSLRTRARPAGAAPDGGGAQSCTNGVLKEGSRFC